MSGLTKRKSSTAVSGGGGVINDESSNNKSSLSETSANLTSQSTITATTNVTINSTNSGESTVGSSSRSKRLKGLVNNEYCSYCDEGGSLINCDRCPASFHLLCHEPPLDHIPKGEFICNACKYSHSHVINNGVNKSTSKCQSVGLFEPFVEQAKSLNPRQMQLGDELSRLCDLKIPGLNRVKWWIHEKCKLNENGGVNHNNNSKNSAKQCFSLLTTNNSNSSNNNGIAESNGEKKSNSQFIVATNGGSNVSDQSEIKRFICFICQKITKNEERLTCDFCPLVFHSMCLFEAHGIVYTSRDKVWMCPNHIEHYLDIHLLKSCRLSERLDLWSRFATVLAEPPDQIVRRFLKKCGTNGGGGPSGGTFLNLWQRQPSVVEPTDIPDSIKQVYSSSIEIDWDHFEDYCDHVEDEYEDQNDTLSTDDLIKIVASKTGDDDRESEKLLCALEALQLLAESSSEPLSSSRLAYDSKLDAYLSLRMPTLSKSLTKPRALLLHIPFSKLVHESSGASETSVMHDLANELVSCKSNTNTWPILMMTRRCLTLGSDHEPNSEDYCCLEELRSRRRCQFVSSRHASIYYDDQSDTYELLNYSEHGTIVDKFVYGLRLEKSRNNKCAFFSTNSDDDDDDDDDKKEAICDCRFVNGRSPRHLSQWEGAAHLKHGSLIQIGCLSFLFVIVDYDFNVETQSEHQLAKRLLRRGKNKTLDHTENPVNELEAMMRTSDKNNTRFNINKRQLLI